MTTVLTPPLDLAAPDVGRRARTGAGLPTWLRPAAAATAALVAIVLLAAVMLTVSRAGLSRVDAGLRRHHAEQQHAERSLVVVNAALHRARR